jgi:hypothetical protein
MRSQHLKLWSLVVLAFYLSGCATMYGRQNDEKKVFFDSNAEGVEVSCSGKSTQTPGNLELRQSKSHNCKARLAGYESRYFRIHSRTSSEGFDYSTSVNKAKWGWWTLGIGILVGWTVDSVSGAMRTLDRDRVYVEMQPLGTSSTQQKVIAKTVNVGKAIVALPTDVVDNTAGAVMDTTVRAGSEQLGVTGPEDRQDTEQTLEGKKEAERLEKETQEGQTPAPAATP